MKEKRSHSASFTERFNNVSFLARNPSTFWNMPPPPLAGFGHPNHPQMPGMMSFGSRPIIPPQAAGPAVNRENFRLYVGNMPNNVTTSMLMQFFNQQMYNLGFPPIVGCQLFLEKNFAFLEFRSAFEATRAMKLDGINLMGKNLKIRRPDKFQPSDNTSSYVDSESPNAIYIGALPYSMNDDQIKELLRPFGKLRSFKHVRDLKTGLSKGYAFCEYEDASITDQVVDALNWMQLGDRKLIVQRASLGAKKAQKAALSAPDRSLSPTKVPPLNGNILEDTKMECTNDGEVDGAKSAQNPALPVGDPSLSPTEVLCLHNMLPPENQRKGKIDDILEDIREECSKYGEVCNVEMVRPIEGKDFPGSANVFVLFESASDCQKAREELSKRNFNGRTVTTSYFDPNKYKKGEF